jgi:predicted ATPase
MGVSLHERSRELERIESSIAAARAGVGALLVIEGPAGIGKTALLSAARERALGRGLDLLAAAGGELERDSAFGVVRQLFGPTLARADEADRAEMLQGAAALAAPLFDPGAHGAPLGPESEHAALHGLYWLTAGMAAQTPLALAVDDLHWADEPSLRFLLYLVQRLEGMPVALAVAFRTAEPGTPLGLVDRLAERSSGELVRPSPLSEAAVGELMRELLELPIDEGVRQACRRATGGNPFLLHALALDPA